MHVLIDFCHFIVVACRTEYIYVYVFKDMYMYI